MIQDLNQASPVTSHNILVSIGSWVAFDMEWEPVNQGKNAIIESTHPYGNELTSVTSDPPETQIHTD